MNIIDFISNNKIGNPPYDYYFLKNLDEKEYPRYLAKLFYLNTGEKLPLKFDFKNKSWIIDKKRCKTFNQKIQWIKLYGITDLMRKCTDKVAVRDYVAEKIGSEYLKPVLQVIPDAKETDYEHICPPCGESTCDSRGKGVSKSSLPLTKCGINEVVYDYEVTHLSPTPSDTNEPPFVLRTTLSENATTPLPFLRQSPQGGQMKSKKYVPALGGSKGRLYQADTIFDQINFDKLPNSFVIKCNHGCKWQYIIKNKEEFLENKRLFDIVKKNITGWLEMDYSFWGGFEMQYKINNTVIASKSTSFQDLRGNPADLKEQNKSQPNHHVTQNVVVPRNDKYIEPKILIEPLLREDINTPVREIEVYCFSGKPKILVKFNANNTINIWNEKLTPMDNIFDFTEENIKIEADNLLKQSYDLSKKLSKDFSFVRVDWMIYKNKLYFEELTFTPYSGMIYFQNSDYSIKLGNYIKLGEKNEL